MNDKNRRVCKDCKHFISGKSGERGGIIGRCKLRDVVGTHRIGSVTACSLYEKVSESSEEVDE